MNIIKASDVKNDRLYIVSNPIQAQKNAIKYLGKNIMLYKSFKPTHKSMILDLLSNKCVHFGSIEYEDVLKHQNKKRQCKISTLGLLLDFPPN